MNDYYSDIKKDIEMKKRRENMDYYNLLNDGNIAQLEKLRANEHKKGFEDIDIMYAFRRLIDEVEELDNEIDSNNNDFSKIRKEAADIANFCHMIILKCDEELKTP